jgi:hypothetical protein
MKASVMNKFAMLTAPLTRVFAIAVFAITCAVLPVSSMAATQKTNGDGSGIGGTGNSPSGGGIGGTGTREQNVPDTMPDLPERPESGETPSVEIPDPPSIDSGAPSNTPELPDPLPEPPQPAGN